MSVLVFGSINMDLVVRTPRLPEPGETLAGRDFSTVPGGKGANQAVALARLEIPTQMVGRVGGDSFGGKLVDSLQGAGVQTDGVLVDAAATSGIAVITVDDAGENEIIIVSGANGRVDATDVERAGVTVILDPAPVRADIPAELYPLIDIMTPNEVEAGQLVGFPISDVETATRAAVELRLSRGVGSAIVKLGAKGVVCATEDETFFIPAFSIQSVDTVAAGDAFNGGLAAALAEGLSLRQAVTWGAAAGALSATKPGAQSSMPDRHTFDNFLLARGIL
jgi:ribokinase